MNILFEHLPKGPLDPRIRDLWCAIAQKTELADPCCSEPPWVMSFHRANGASRRVLMLFERGNAVCLAEEIDEATKKAFLVPLESAWLYDRPILGQDPIPLFFRAIEYMEEEYRGKPFPDIILGGILPHHPMSNELLLNLGHAFAFYCVSKNAQCSASLQGGVDTFLANRSANFRQKLKKAVRRASLAGICYERCQPESLPEAQAIYARMLDVERRSWKGKDGDGITNPSVRQFYAYLIEDLAIVKKARVIFATKDGLDIGFIFGGLSNRIYRGQQFSYDLTYAAYSVGNILQLQQILWLAEENCLRYDLGPITGPKMEYKRHWSELTFPMESWLLRRHVTSGRKLIGRPAT